MAAKIATPLEESLAMSQEDLWRQRLAEQQHLAEKASNFLRSELSALRSASAEDSLRQVQERFLEEKELLKARMSSLAKEHQQQLRSIASASAEEALRQVQERFLEEKELLKARMSSLAKEHQQQLELHVQKLEQQASLGQRLSIYLEAKQRETQEFLSRLQAEARRLYEEKVADVSRLCTEKENILRVPRAYWHSLSATTMLTRNPTASLVGNHRTLGTATTPRMPTERLR